MNIYTKDGWLDVPHINEVADRNDINFVIIIGKRQVGKTYNVLKFMLDQNKQFIFMRRTSTELEMLEHDVNSPFEKIYKGQVYFNKESKYTAEITRLDFVNDEEVKTRIGMGCALSTLGNIRGFNGDVYTDWVFDEFIPEQQLFKVRNERDAFLNAHVTINGNRELEGRKCVRVWLLANSNNLDSGILEALNISREVERMSLRDEETRILKERGIMVLMPESRVIIEKRKQTGLARAIKMDSTFARMAFENEFAYNDYTDVHSMPLMHYNPICSVGDITVMLHKNDKSIYITDRVNQRVRHDYPATESGIRKFNVEYSDVRSAYLQGRAIFNNQRVKSEFLRIVKA